MDFAGFIRWLSPWVLFPLTVLLGVIATELGVWLSKKARLAEAGGPPPPTGSLVGAILGLLAFMLGFTFSNASTRYSNRKELVIQQARAISTCYLRSGIIPEPQKNEIRALLTDYIGILVNLKNPSDIDSNVSKLEILNLQIWDKASSLVRENMDPDLRALYIQSVNEIIENYSKRKTIALVHRVPNVIWGALYLLFILGMFIVGHEISESRRRRLLNTPIMAAAFALIVTVIADMDSASSSRNFKANLQPLIDAQKMMKAVGP